MSSPEEQPKAGQPAPRVSPTPPVPVALAEEALRRADRAFDSISRSVGVTGSPKPEATNGDRASLRLLDDVDLDVRIELGRTRMLVEDVLRLGTDSVVELDKAAGDPVDIYVNGRHIARGEVLVVNENFCVRVSEILEPLDRGAGVTTTP